MKHLSPKEYWDSVYKDINNTSERDSVFFVIKERIKLYTRDYSNHLIWDIVFKKFLPTNNALKIIEVGCAPGKYLINFNKDFGYMPFGVEYSKKGELITKENFSNNGLDTNNVFLNDFFDETFQANNKEKFDIVFSRGFIEHFDDVQRVVDLHLNLLKKGGHLIILIPNLSGLNYFFAKFLNNDSLVLHNLSIMNKEKFSALFDKSKVSALYSDYVGIFSFGLFNTNSKLKYFLHRFLVILQRPFDFLFRIILGRRIPKNKNTSPYLLFVGIKQ